jgi:hypothetical protein
MRLVAGVAGIPVITDVEGMPSAVGRGVEPTEAFDCVRRSIVPVGVVPVAIEAEPLSHRRCR